MTLFISRVVLGVATLAGAGFGAYVAIFPAASPEQAHTYLRLGVVFFVVALGALLMTNILDHRREANMLSVVEGLYKQIEALSPTSSESEAATTQKTISFSELGEAAKAATQAGDDTVAAKIVGAIPKPKNFRQEVFDLVTATRECLRAYHGGLDVDSFVAPEIGNVLTQRLIATRRRLEKFLKGNVVREQAKFPVTVRRMSMLLEDLERAASELQEDIPPS
jgi:hypothetical protein